MGAAQRFGRPLCAVLLAIACACVPRTAPPRPLPAPPLPPPPAPAPAPPPEPRSPTAWQDRALAEGDWSYAGAGPGAEAGFGTEGGTRFALRCEAGRQIALLRPGAPAGPVTIVTSFGEHRVPAALAASDPLFDEIAFSRGRFLVRSAEDGDLVLPTWPEPARLIEDCRG